MSVDTIPENETSTAVPHLSAAIRSPIKHPLTMVTLALRPEYHNVAIEVLETAFLTSGLQTYREDLFDNIESYNNYCDTLDRCGWVVGEKDASLKMVPGLNGKVIFRYFFEKEGKPMVLGIVTQITPEQKLSLTDEALQEAGLFIL